MTSSNLDTRNATLPAIAAALREGSLRAMDLTEQAIATHERWGKTLSAYALWTPELARETAAAADKAFAAGARTGPLQGIPYSAKDVYGVHGLPTFAGSPKRLPSRWEQEGPVIAGLRRQLAVLTGKTHMVEFSFGGTGANSHWGPPRNPWSADKPRSPGGSSSGAGVSLAEGSAFFALAADAAGSVRIPASATGQVGLKTTIGRWSGEGLVPLSYTYDTPGVLTRNSVDAAYCFGAIDPAWGDADAFLTEISRDVDGVRIGFGEPALWNDCAPDVAQTVKAALEKLERAGARLQDHRVPAVAEGVAVFREGGISGCELAGFLKAELPEWIATLDPLNAPVVANAGSVPSADYVARVLRLGRLAENVRVQLAEVDVLACPTLAHAPMLLADIVDNEKHWAGNRELTRNTVFVNFFGLCAITLPVGLDRIGMPVGLELVALPHHEEKLLGIACAVERVLGRPADVLGRPPLLK
jgi:aspartyl-tRNA(Asn)/glutamyl-tRNA(Gln) amidotransferase subunit A